MAHRIGSQTMRGLFGDFTTMPLKDLVVYLGNRQATGVLTLERSGVKKQVQIKGGVCIAASSNEPREYLGQFLINMGHITEEQFHKAYQTQQETKIFLGKILVMIGLVSEQTILTALSMKIRETLLDAFLWQEGFFNFDATTEPTSPDGIDLKIDLLDIHREGEFRETAWQAIRAAFPSGKVRLELNERNLPEPPKPGSLDARLVELIRQGHTIDEMVLGLHATDFFLYQRLYALYRLEAVTVADSVDVALDDEPSVLVDHGSGMAVDEMVREAERLMRAGQLPEAESLAKRAHELSASPETAELLQKVEEELLGRLRKALMQPNAVPSLMVSPSRLREMSLTAPEKYLLSRVDGRRDVASIVTVSPLRELDALKYFQKFVDDGLVKVSRG